MGDWSGSEEETYEERKDRAKRLLRHGRAVKLEDEYEHAKAMSENTKIPAKQREVWKQIAHELATRLGYNAPPSEQIPLF